MELKNFNDCITAFINFKNGGWWIEEIEKEGIEEDEESKKIKIIGPYSKIEKENEEKRSKNVKEFYSFFQIIKKYTLDDKNWKPPLGSLIFLLILNKIDVCYYKETNDKIINFAINNDIKIIDLKDKGKIFYKNIPQSFFSAKEIYNYLIDNNNINFLNKIIFKEKNFFNREYKYYYTPEDFKGMSVEKLVKNLKKTLEVNKIYFQYLEDNNIEWNFNVKVLKNNQDLNFKNLIFKYKEFLKEGEIIFQNKYSFTFKNNFSDLTEIKILNYEKVVIEDLKLLIKILKSLKIKKIKIKDNNFEKCKDYVVNKNIICNLAGEKNIFEDLNLKRENFGNYKIILNKYKNLKIEELDKKILYNKYTISEIAKLYIKSRNRYSDICEIASIISELITDELNENSNYYMLNL